MLTIYSTVGQGLLRNRSEANADSTEAELQKLNVELQEIQRQIGEIQLAAQEEMQAKEQELFTPLLQKVNTAVQSVAKENGYAYVFDLANASFQAFEGSDDLTAQVNQRLVVADSGQSQ